MQKNPCLLSEKNSGDAIRIYEGNDVRTCTKKRLGKKEYVIEKKGKNLERKTPNLKESREIEGIVIKL